jgi:hypothetical protein
VPVTDRAFDAASWQAVKTAVPARADGAAVLFVADQSTMTLPEHPILVVDLLNDYGGPPFRCIPAELWAVENNLNVANMSWEESASELDEDGVYRSLATSCRTGRRAQLGDA